MWVLEATFDGAEVPFRKLLKPNKEYQFGRKAPADLILADKTVSKESATIYVGPSPTDEEHERPSLQVHALKRQIRIIAQDQEEDWRKDRDRVIGESVSPDHRKQLQDGDIVVLTKSAPSVKVIWLPMVITVSSKVSKEVVEQKKLDCKSLGIRLERSKQQLPNTTHLVLPSSAALTVPVMQAVIVAAHIVTIEYVVDIVRRAKLGKEEEESLERRFSLPNPAEYFPDDFPIEDMTKAEIKEALAVNESRKMMFVGTTFLFMHGKEGLNKGLDSMMALCKSAGGRIVTENASKLATDESLLHLLRRHKSEAETILAGCGEDASQAPDEGLVVICGPDDMETDWHRKVVQMTRQMSIAMPSLHGAAAISKAILHADARQYLNQIADMPPSEQHHSQDIDTETLPPTGRTDREEVADPPAATTTRFMDHDQNPPHSPKVAQMQSTPAPLPTTTASTSEKKSPRKPRRRADMVRHDPLEDIFGPSAPDSLASTGVVAAVSSTAEEAPPTQATLQSSRPPRRYNVAGNKRPRMSETYRNLFETKDEGPFATENENIASTHQESTQSKTRKYRMELDEADRLATQGGEASSLDNEAESQPATQAEEQLNNVTRKRRAQSPPTHDAQPALQRRKGTEQVEVNEEEMDEIRHETPSTSAVPAIAASVRVGTLLREKAPSTAKTGSGDTDTKFLQAMATSKRSKKGMDQFDREFNLLRLAKPTRVTGHHGKIIADVDDPEYRAWEQMGPSDFDINAAGNFVQVDFVPLVYHRSEEEEAERAKRQVELQGKWKGKPNFKKFRTKQRSQRKPLAMDVDEGLDYGLGNGYTRAPRASARVTTSVQEEGESEDYEMIAPPPKTGPTRSQKGYHADPFSDEEESIQSRRPTQKPVISQVRSRQNHTRREKERDVQSQRRSAAVDVRLDVDADLDDSIYGSRRPTPPPSTRSSSTVRGSKRSVLDLSSDDDDESGNFSGFRKKRRD